MEEKLLGEPNRTVAKSFIIGSVKSEPEDFLNPMGQNSQRVSFQIASDIPEYPEYYNSTYTEELDYGSLIGLFLFACIIPIFYTIALVVDIRQKWPVLMSKCKALCLIASVSIFTIFFWVTIGLYISHNSMWKFSFGEIGFILFIFLICCIGEAFLKSSYYTPDEFYLQYRQYIINYKLDTEHTVATLIDIIRSKISPTNIRSKLFLLNIFLSSSTASLSEFFRFLSFEVSPNVNMVMYSLSSIVVRFFLSYFIFHYLSEAIIQLYQRYQESAYFCALTSKSQSSKFDIPHISLSTKTNLLGFMYIRSILLREYTSKLFIDIILSISLIISLPLTLFVSYTIIFHKVTLTVIYILPLIFVIFMYIAVAFLLSLKARDGFNHTYMLQMAKVSNLYSEDYDPTLISLFEELSNILKMAKDEATIITVFGVSISKSVIMVFFGLSISSVSSLLSKLFT